MARPVILVVEDDKFVAMAIGDFLRADDYDVVTVGDGAGAEQALARQAYDLILLDLMLPDADGRTLLVKWRRDYPDSMVIIMTGLSDVTAAVECIKAGAHDYLLKPLERVILLRSLRNAITQRSLSRRVTTLTSLHQRDLSAAATDCIIAASPAMARTVEMAKRIAATPFSCVLLQGESGTGKGLLARTIHRTGRRAALPFIEVDCSAIHPSLAESELFGHVRGSFTDAKEDRMGLFELADGGTLFLDEIGDMPISLQVKLLKIIEDQRFRRVGGVQDISVDVAILAATNQDLAALVEAGRFRADLYYRLNVIPLALPPLRERPEDIMPLADLFIGRYARKVGSSVTAFTADAIAVLRRYGWPGNVRELRNVVERGCILAKGETIPSELLALALPGAPQGLAPDPRRQGGADLPPMPLAQAEKRAIQAALAWAKGNRNQAAAILDIHRQTLYKKLAEYQIADADSAAWQAQPGAGQVRDPAAPEERG